MNSSPLSLVPTVGRKNEYQPTAAMFCGWRIFGALRKYALYKSAVFLRRLKQIHKFKT